MRRGRKEGLLSRNEITPLVDNMQVRDSRWSEIELRAKDFFPPPLVT